jgi:hypothetical protein
VNKEDALDLIAGYEKWREGVRQLEPDTSAAAYIEFRRMAQVSERLDAVLAEISINITAFENRPYEIERGDVTDMLRKLESI